VGQGGPQGAAGDAAGAVPARRRELLVNRTSTETRVALLEDGRLAELFIEKEESRSLVGNIYKGKVSKILPGMQSAFVSIGLPRDAFLHVHDVLEPRRPAPDPGEEEAETPGPEPSRAIEEILQEGQEILVQIVKEPIQGKGARITTQVTLPGRFLVLMPGVRHVGISRKISDPDERARLRELMRAGAGNDDGFIVRTAGEGASGEEIAAEAGYLSGLWQEILRRSQVAPVETLLQAEFDPVRRILRDLYSAPFHLILVDDRLIFEDCREFLGMLDSRQETRLEYYSDPVPLFDRYAVQTELDRALRSRVWLRSGGYIVINQTEALVAIDVNTGKYVGKRRLEETVLRTNLEAAVEIVHQIRLRDLGGIIVVDFIDMEEEASKRALLDAFHAELLRDRARTKLLQISDFGLVEITRQRTRRSLERTLCRPCPACRGSGRIKRTETLYFEIQRELQRLARSLEGKRLVLRAHPELADLLEERRHHVLDVLAPGHRFRLSIERDPSMDREQFDILSLPE
jgi:ribonuclease G